MIAAMVCVGYPWLVLVILAMIGPYLGGRSVDWWTVAGLTAGGAVSELLVWAVLR